MVLAHERGPFPYLEREPFLPNPALAEQDASAGFARRTWEMRNVSVTCLAPTGGITLLTKNRGFAIEPFFNEATKVSAAGHIAMASAWQTGMCNSVSKTVNLPESATVHDVRDAIKLAYQLRNIKALSVYRANSRSAQPIET
jgi:ribonucleotide reductase alpha subunit